MLFGFDSVQDKLEFFSLANTFGTFFIGQFLYIPE